MEHKNMEKKFIPSKIMILFAKYKHRHYKYFTAMSS